MALRPCRECGQLVSTDAKTCLYCGKRHPTRSWAAIGCFMLMVLAAPTIIAKFFGGGHSTIPTPSSAYAPPSSVSAVALKSQVKQKLRLDFAFFERSSVTMVNFRIANQSDRAVKDLTIICTYFGPSRTKIDSKTRAIYGVVPARSTKRISAFNMGSVHSQARTGYCTIEDFELAALTLLQAPLCWRVGDDSGQVPGTVGTGRPVHTRPHPKASTMVAAVG